MQFVRRCYGLRGIYGRFDSKIRFEIESDGRFDSRFDSNAKNDSQVPRKVERSGASYPLPQYGQIGSITRSSGCLENSCLISS